MHHFAGDHPFPNHHGSGFGAYKEDSGLPRPYSSLPRLLERGWTISTSICLRIRVIFSVGFKGNLSLRDLFYFFSGVLAKWWISRLRDVAKERQAVAPAGCARLSIRWKLSTDFLLQQVHKYPKLFRIPWGGGGGWGVGGVGGRVCGGVGVWGGGWGVGGGGLLGNEQNVVWLRLSDYSFGPRSCGRISVVACSAGWTFLQEQHGEQGSCQWQHHQYQC